MKNELNPDGILCAIDVNDFDQDVVDLAATFAQQSKRDLDILHVTLMPDPTTAAWPAYVGSPDIIAVENRMLRKVKTSVSNVTIVHHHISGLPSKKILDFVERNQPKLLVMGTHGRRGLSRVLGSVASKVMRHASCPVMIIRQRQNSQELSEKKYEEAT